MAARSFRLPVFQTRPRYVVVLSDQRFFVRTVPLAPAEAGDKTAPGDREQVEIALEALAPFPMSQLYWGYWTRLGCDRALVFAAYKKRFTADETAEWGEAEWVAPRFGALLAGKAPEPATTWIVRADDGLTALHFADSSGLPTRVETLALDDTAAEPAWTAARDALLRRTGGTRVVIDIDRLEIDPGKPGDDELQIKRGDHEFALDLNDAQKLDVRDGSELLARARARTRDMWLWRGLVAAGVLLVLSLLGEAGLLGSEMWQKGRKVVIARQVPVVSEIETADRLATQVERLRTQRLRPFEMIALVDRPRPASVIFTSTTATDLYTMEIEAETDVPTDVNIYISALTDLGGIARVETQRNDLKGSRATVRLLVTFSPDAFDTTAKPEEGAS